MNWLDIVLLFIFVISIIGGARSGLIKSVTSLAALILGVVLAVRFYPQFGLWLQRFIANQTGSRVVAFVIILAVVLVAGAIASYVLGRAARALGIGWADRIGGAVFGLVIAAVVFGGMLSALSSIPGATGVRNTIDDSFVASLLLDRVLPVLGGLSPIFDNPRGWLDQPVPY